MDELAMLFSMVGFTMVQCIRFVVSPTSFRCLSRLTIACLCLSLVLYNSRNTLQHLGTHQIDLAAFLAASLESSTSTLTLVSSSFPIGSAPGGDQRVGLGLGSGLVAANSELNKDQVLDCSGIDNKASNSENFFFEDLLVLELVWFRGRVGEDLLDVLDAYVEMNGGCVLLESRVDWYVELDKRRRDVVEALVRVDFGVIGRLDDADEGRVDVASDVIDRKDSESECAQARSRRDNRKSVISIALCGRAAKNYETRLALCLLRNVSDLGVAESITPTAMSSCKYVRERSEFACKV